MCIGLCGEVCYRKDLNGKERFKFLKYKSDFKAKHDDNEHVLLNLTYVGSMLDDCIFQNATHFPSGLNIWKCIQTCGESYKS